MKLISNYPNEVFDIACRFKDEKRTLKDLNKTIESMSSDIPEDNRNKFKGDVFEIFASMFFKAFKNDPSVGLVEYAPITIEDDFGVDGTGINANNDSVAVQVKYRRSLIDLISYTDIAKTYASGQIMLKLDLNKKNSIYVFTNSNDVTPACKTVFGNIVKVLNGDSIDHYIHNNVNFWNFFYEEVYNYLDE